jgi:hypothetical protein
MDLHGPEEKVFLETIRVPDRGLKLRKNIKISLDMGFQSSHILLSTSTGSMKANRREPKSCLGQVLNFKLGCFVMYITPWHIQAFPSLELKTLPAQV